MMGTSSANQTRKSNENKTQDEDKNLLWENNNHGERELINEEIILLANEKRLGQMTDISPGRLSASPTNCHLFTCNNHRKKKTDRTT